MAKRRKASKKKAARKSRKPAAGRRKTKAKKKKTAKKTTARKKAAGSRSARGKRADSALITDLRQFIRTQKERFLKDSNITSLGIGYKVRNGKRTSELCIQFTVRSKVEDAVSALELLGTERIPETLDVAGRKVPTDVLQRDYRPAFRVLAAESVSERKQRQDPIMPGISVSHPLGTAGTLGLIVFDRDTGSPCMLSNWHVLHGGDGEIGDDVVQPGPFDDAHVEGNRAGVLIRSHLGNAGDCAIARIEDRDFDHTIFDLGVIPEQIGRVELGDRVIKSGRTTDVTRGIVRRIDVIARISYEVGERDIGCFEIGPEEGAPPDFEVSMGGDSGSAWMIARNDGRASDVFVGLHFAGEGAGNPDEHALACYAHSVFKKLNIDLVPPSVPAEAIGGYNPSFLSELVRTPALTAGQRTDAFKLNGSELLHYTHFSVCQSKSRRLPRFVAWNIDGARIKRVSRSGISFKLDNRVSSAFQAGNELYKNNKLDRGHVARRADLCWGSITEAKKANKDSFFFTNITPQHEAFNQSSKSGLWGELENAVLDEVDVTDLRVSVIGGPIFGEDDPEHRGVKIPRAFWKLIAYRDADDDQFKVRAYVLTQDDLLYDIEALELDPFRLFQVSLDKLREKSGLDFSALDDFDTHEPGVGPEALSAGPVREVASAADLIL